MAECGVLRRRGFLLLPTDAEPHYDVVLPELGAATIERVVACFESQPNPARRR